MDAKGWGDGLLEFVCMFHRGIEVLNAATSALSFVAGTLAIDVFLI